MSFALRPSSIIVMQNGQATATASGLVSSACSTRRDVDALARLFLHPHAAAAGAAAHAEAAVALHLAQLHAGDHAEDVARRVEDVVVAAEVAGVVDR